MSAKAGDKRLKNIGEGRHPYLGTKWEVFGPVVRGAGQACMNKTLLPSGSTCTQVKPTTVDSRAIPPWSDSPEWAVDEHVESCIGQGLVSSDAVHAGAGIQDEVAELAQLDAELDAFQACTDTGQVDDVPTDPFEEDPFGHGAGHL